MEAQEFSTGEVSQLVGVSVPTLYRWLRQKRLPDPLTSPVWCCRRSRVDSQGC